MKICKTSGSTYLWATNRKTEQVKRSESSTGHTIQNEIRWLQASITFSDSLWLIYSQVSFFRGFPSGSAVKNLPAMEESQEMQVQSPVGKIPWSRKWQPTEVFLPGESHEQRSLEGYSPWGCKESDTTEWLNWTELKVYMKFKCKDSPKINLLKSTEFMGLRFF